MSETDNDGKEIISVWAGGWQKLNADEPHRRTNKAYAKRG